MGKGRERSEWNRTAMVLAVLWASYRTKFEKGKQPKAMTPEEFNPYTEEAEPIPVPITALRDVFVKKKKK